MVRVSKRGTPPSKRKIISNTVMAKYIKYNNLDVVAILGTNLPTEGPGLSALIKCMPCPPDIGTIARIKTRTPIPPIQLEKLLQKRMDLGRLSTSRRIVNPVVEKPD